MKTFSTWNYEQVEGVFNLSELKTGFDFQNWLTAEDCEPTNFESEQLENHKTHLFEEINNWNSDELNFFSISHILNIVNFQTPYFKPFAKRKMAIKTEVVSTSGTVDYIIAKGKMTPKTPYFCLHEYKQENRRDNDPLGQLLIGMVAAQHKNDYELPIYGSYISGRNWFFVLLDGKNYYLSNAYNASDDDIYKNFSILKKSKTLMENHAKQLSLA